MEHVCRQGSLPRGLTIYTRHDTYTQDTDTGNGASSRETGGLGSHELGHRRAQALSFWLSLRGRERSAGRNPGQPSRKQQYPGGTHRGKKTPEGGGPRYREGWGNISEQAWTKTDPEKQKWRKAKSPGKGPSQWQGTAPCAGPELSLTSGSVFQGCFHGERLNRSSGQGSP